MKHPIRRPYQLHLFTLRLWKETLDAERFEWRGEIKNTASGESRYFRDAYSLYAALVALLNEPPAPARKDVDSA